jgi:hypothetical protein
LTGQCKFEGNLFCFFLPPAKKERNPTHNAHIGKAPRANAPTKALPKSAILSTHSELTIEVVFYIVKRDKNSIFENSIVKSINRIKESSKSDLLKS